MSTGHLHANHSIRAEHTAQLQRLMSDPKFIEALKNYTEDDDTHEVQFLAGSDNAGRKVFNDRRFAKAIRDGNIRYDGKPYDPQPFVRTHETTEGALLRGQYHPGNIIMIVPRSQGFDYPTAHDIATAAEKHAVETAGLDWNKHQQSMQNIIRIVGSQRMRNPPPDLLRLPYEKSEQHEGARLKLSHKAVHYGQGMPQSHCSICLHYIAQGPACEIVKNPILEDGWCNKFEKE